MTLNWSFDLDELLELIAKMAINDQHRYYGVLLRLVHLRNERKHEFPSYSVIESAYWAGEYRFKDVYVDEVRFLFPLLGLKWEYGWTLQQGLKKVMGSYPDEILSG